MFKLQVANTDITNGNIAVSWCVDAEVLKVLADLGITNPQVVIITSPTEGYHNSKEYRKVVPLKDLMTYVEFKSSGDNKIWGYVSRMSMPKIIRNDILTKERGSFQTDILTQNGAEYTASIYSDLLDLFYAEPISVNVPKGVFAKEPAKWERVWVNHWFRSKPQDQCDFRSRRLLAYSVQPIFVLLDVLVFRLSMLLISTLWLSRGMSFKYLIHPLRYSIVDSLEVLQGGTWTIPTLPEDADGRLSGLITISYAVRKLWKTPLIPLVFIPLLLIYHFHAMMILGGIISAIVLVIIFSTDDVARLFKTTDAKFFSQVKVPKPWYLDQEEIQNITCGANMKNPTKLSDLPKKHRTIHLHFQELKARICRPFSS